jgi:hypothetical protein
MAKMTAEDVFELHVLNLGNLDAWLAIWRRNNPTDLTIGEQYLLLQGGVPPPRIHLIMPSARGASWTLREPFAGTTESIDVLQDLWAHLIADPRKAYLARSAVGVFPKGLEFDQDTLAMVTTLYDSRGCCIKTRIIPCDLDEGGLVQTAPVIVSDPADSNTGYHLQPHGAEGYSFIDLYIQKPGRVARVFPYGQ